RQRARRAEELDACAQAAGLGSLRHARSGCRHQRAVRPRVALMVESVSAFGEVAEESARGQQGATRVRRGTHSVRARARVPRSGCAEGGTARAVAKTSGPVSNESERRAQAGAHLSPGESPPESAGAAGNGARANARPADQRQWKSRCAWESRTPRGIPTFPQPQQQTFGYISNVSTTSATVTFLNGSTGTSLREFDESPAPILRGESISAPYALFQQPKRNLSGNLQATGARSYRLCELVEMTVRASGCFGDQSSGGKATRQKVGQGEENSNPISALPERTGPRNTT